MKRELDTSTISLTDSPPESRTGRINGTVSLLQYNTEIWPRDKKSRKDVRRMNGRKRRNPQERPVRAANTATHVAVTTHRELEQTSVEHACASEVYSVAEFAPDRVYLVRDKMFVLMGP